MRWAFSSRNLAALVAAFFVFANAAFALAPNGKPQQLPLDPQPLTIQSKSGVQTILIEVADERAEREIGLMYRQKVPENQGMLFDFGLSREVTMWMRNTPSSLDILFVNDKGVIITIAENTVPFSSDIIASRGLTRFALELAAGSATARAIKVGDRVHHRVIDAIAGP